VSILGVKIVRWETARAKSEKGNSGGKNSHLKKQGSNILNGRSKLGRKDFVGGKIGTKTKEMLS